MNTELLNEKNKFQHPAITWSLNHSAAAGLTEIPELFRNAPAAQVGSTEKYMGSAYLPFDQVETIIDFVRAGRKAEVERFVSSTGSCNNSVSEMNDLNHYACTRALENADLSADEIRQEWYKQHYPEQYCEKLIELDKLCREVIENSYFIDKHVLIHEHYGIDQLKTGFVFALFAEGRRTLANGRGIWSILSDRETPGRYMIFEEKKRAVLLAGRGWELLKKIDPPAGDYRWQLWKNALGFTRAVYELVRCTIAYFDDMEWEKPDHPHLRAQIEASLNEFKRLTEDESTDQKFREAVLKPLAALCRKLELEFTAEYSAKQKFLTGCEDGIIIGGITDDWRIARNIYTPHTMLHNGIPSRTAGNREYPDGFIEIELERGEELVIYGAPEETRQFTLTCDGRRRTAEFDGQGMFSLPLEANKEKVRIRLEKSGEKYPRFYAALTRNAGWREKKRIPLFTWLDTVMPKDLVPEPIYAENPELIDLYYAAWQSAWTHIFSCRKAPVSPYMNEGIRCHKIWIWDTCFMVHFCKYAPDVFPGIQSLDNFYRVMHDGENTGLKVSIPDNPPLFAWTEYEYLKHTGDKERVRKVLSENRYLQRHYQWLNELQPDTLFDYATCPTGAHLVPGKGFRWHADKAGMDNTPRGDDDYSSIYYVDMSCQQALSALYISHLAEVIGDTELSRTWLAEYEAQKNFVNERFWSESDRMYFDRKVDESGFCKVLTPASMWPMLAEIADERQVDALVEALTDPNRLGGEYPLPSLSRDDHRFSPVGEYWRGGIWMPKVYMTIKGLEKNGRTRLADEIAKKMILQQFRTWKNFEPHTIWECYSPTGDKPSTNKVNKYSRPDFCGWSALGPISLFIENMLGIREVDALKKRIVWTPYSAVTSGIRNLKMGGNSFTLMAYPDRNTAVVEAAHPFTLCLNGKEICCHAGKNEIPLA